MEFVSNKFKKIAFVLAVILTVSMLDFSSVSKVFAEETSDQVTAEQNDGTEETSTEISSETETTGQTETETTTEQTETETTKPTETETTTAEQVKKITPAAVTKLKTASVKTDGIKLSWASSKNATEYRIYRSAEKKNGKMSGAKKIKTTKSTSMEDIGLAQGTKYEYSVYAYRVADGKKTHSKATKISVLTKPAPVTKVQVSKKTIKSVSINWKKNAKAGKYIIYRADEKSKGTFGEYKKVKELKSSKNTFTDKKVSSGKLYQYKVVVQRTSGKLSVLSSGKTVKVMTSLQAPKKLKKKKATANSIQLTWKKAKGAEQYEIYRDGKLVKTTKKTSYTDKNLSAGVTYQYTVKAVRTYQKKKYKSEAASIDAATSDAVNGTWVEVSIEKQMMYMYVNNKLYVKTPVVTGNAGALSTTKGHHHVLSKSSPARLRGSYNGKSWDVTVNYWLGFTSDGQGLHDSTWRSAYGGSIYKGNGSHGCVNTPLSAMKKIYSKAYVGMPVIVH